MLNLFLIIILIVLSIISVIVVIDNKATFKLSKRASVVLQSNRFSILINLLLGNHKILSCQNEQHHLLGLVYIQNIFNAKNSGPKRIAKIRSIYVFKGLLTKNAEHRFDQSIFESWMKAVIEYYTQENYQKITYSPTFETNGDFTGKELSNLFLFLAQIGFIRSIEWNDNGDGFIQYTYSLIS